MNKQAATLSIIIPSYNEEATIIQLLDKVLDVELVYGFRKEIIIVDDGSTDKTRELVFGYIKRHLSETIHYIQHTANQGKGKAIRTGLEKITGKYVIIQDADLEYEPENYNTLLTELIEKNKKVIYGSRFMKNNKKHSHPLFYLGGKVVTWYANILYKQHLTDEPTCYKMFDTELLKSLPLVCKGFEFCPEVTARIAKAGYQIDEIPIIYYSRSKQEGKKIKWTDGIIAIWTLVKYRFTN